MVTKTLLQVMSPPPLAIQASGLQNVGPLWPKAAQWVIDTCILALSECYQESDKPHKLRKSVLFP